MMEIYIFTSCPLALQDEIQPQRNISTTYLFRQFSSTMYIPTLTSLLTNSLLLTLTTTTTAHPWPAAPFYADGRWILNTEGTHVTYAGVNWPGAADTMLPEGLQFQSISTIVSSIKSLGMNVIRLTYAIEMIDDILDHGGDVDIKTSFVRALGEANGTTVYEMVVEKNPRFHGKTTRLDVFDAVAEECAKQQIYVHLDNHVSQAKWCCSETDGNAWFGDTYFDVAKWQRGLVYMATHVRPPLQSRLQSRFQVMKVGY